MLVVLSLLAFVFTLGAYAEVTIYTQIPLLGTPTSSSIPAKYTTLAAVNDPTELTPPPIPSPPIPSQLPIQLSMGGMQNLSIPQKGSFVGFSVELSVADQIFGKNGSFINPTFLNLLANIKARAGHAIVRVGGNTQEKAVFFPQGLPGGATIHKDKQDVTNPTLTPALQVGIDLIFAMANISSLVNTHWFIGMPFDDPSQPRLEITESSSQILGQYLLGVQVGNEPDLYGFHGSRPSGYAPADFVNEFGLIINAIQADNGISNKSNLIGPSTCCRWTPEDVLNAGFLDMHADSIGYLSVERYETLTHAVLMFVPSYYADSLPSLTWFSQGLGNIPQSQDAFPKYLSHDLSVQTLQPYADISNVAQQHGKPFIMMESNTASCGGFPGLSDTFGAALWGIDWSLQLAYANFSAVMMHLGGQNVYYNPFTPPPGGLLGKAGWGWTIGPMYYVSLIISEVLGSSNASQVVDLTGDNAFTPVYAIYENGNPTRVTLLNFVTDPSGASNYTAQIMIGGDAVGQPNASPPQVNVRYFAAPSVSSKGGFMWGNQTFGGPLSSNGIPVGTPATTAIACQNNVCSVPVPAPGFALVFLSDSALQESSPQASDLITFSTTVATKGPKITATIDPSVLATSNGWGGSNQRSGSTSFSSNDAAARYYVIPGALTLACLVVGLAIVWKGFV